MGIDKGGTERRLTKTLLVKEALVGIAVHCGIQPLHTSNIPVGLYKCVRLNHTSLDDLEI
jgi:hypothetical protein